MFHAYPFFFCQSSTITKDCEKHQRISKILSERTERGEKLLMLLFSTFKKKKIQFLNNHRSQEGCVVYRKTHGSSLLTNIPTEQGSYSHKCCAHSRQVRNNSVQLWAPVLLNGAVGIKVKVGFL